MKAMAFPSAVLLSRLTGLATAARIPSGDRLAGSSVDRRPRVVVNGPSITDGYLGQGHCGAAVADGRSWRVRFRRLSSNKGRKDSLIVTSYGRNISPEWIETMLLGDLRIAFCAVVGHGEPHLSAVIVPSGPGESWFAHAIHDEVLRLISRLLLGRARICGAAR